MSKFQFLSAGRGRTALSIAGVLVFAVLLYASSACRTTTNAQNATQPNAPLGSTSVRTSFADVVDRVGPSVVMVRAEKRTKAPQQNEDFLRQFFGNQIPQMQQQQPRDQVERGLGSGVIVNSDGTILTNYHVVDGAEDIKVDLNDKRTLSAKVIGTDKPSDLAVLKVDASNLPALPLGDSDKMRVGDVVLAIGNPLGLQQTVTMGIISAKDRQTGVGDGSFEDFLQTDAPINHGNSGGALINTNGELVGINSQILSGGQQGGSIGIGFAIPSNMAKSVMDQLLATGKVRRGQLGIGIQAVTSDLAASLGLKDVRGVVVNEVRPGSAGEKAGIKQEDVITAFNGALVNDSNDLRNRVAGSQPGTDVTLTVLRDGREQQIKATLGEFKPAEEEAAAVGGSTEGDSGLLGVQVEPLTPELAKQVAVPTTTQGLIVGQVTPGSPADDAGIIAGDVIMQINHQPVKTSADVKAALSKSGDKPALVLINRRGSTVYLPVRIK